MTMLTETLSRFFDRPIQDHTKAEGRFDIVFPMKPEEYTPMMIRAAVNGGIPMPPQALAMLDGASAGSVHDGLKALGLAWDIKVASLAQTKKMPQQTNDAVDITVAEPVLAD